MFKQASRKATVAWSPQQHYPVALAAGTVAGAVDLDFSSDGRLELFDLNLEALTPELTSLGSIDSNGRFHKLCWSPLGLGGDVYSSGLLAGAMDSGRVNIWNPKAILSGQGNALVGCGDKHTGPVHGLDFNALQPNILASGAGDSEIYIWDVSDPSTPTVYSPGQKHQQAVNVSAVAWNKKMAHILASTSFNGVSVVWDLKVQKPVISFRDSRQQLRCRTILWNPEVATQVVTVSENDENPAVQVWDLRNAMAPTAELFGHTKGILSAEWNPKDPELLMTCGKDQRTIVWNPQSGEMVMELPAADNWVFDAAWCPRVPAMVSTCSFDGKLSVYSVMDSYPRAGSFLDPSNAQGPPTQMERAPKWLKRPAGAAFAFGGKLVSFGAPVAPGQPTGGQVKVHSVVTNQDVLERSSRLEACLDTKDPPELREFCRRAAENSSSQDDRAIWNVMAILFEEKSRVELVKYLGYNVETLSQQVAEYVAKVMPATPTAADTSMNTTAAAEVLEEAAPEEVQANAGEQADSQMAGLFGGADDGAASSLFGGGANTEEDDPFRNIGQQQATTGVAAVASQATPGEAAPVPEENPFKPLPIGTFDPISIVSDTSMEGMTTRALMCGDWEAAVNCRIAAGKPADALLLAAAGGPDLYNKTRDWFVRQHADPFFKIVSNLIKGDYLSIAQTAHIGQWREALALLCTYAPPDQFSSLCDVLGQRLLSEAKDSSSALLCFMCAGNADAAVPLWKPLSSSPSSPTRVQELQELLEKTIIFREAVSHVESAQLDLVLSEYASILASQGRLTGALRFLSLLSTSSATTVNDTMPGAVLRDRVFHACAPAGETPPPFPFVVEDPTVVRGAEYAQQGEDPYAGQYDYQTGQYYDQNGQYQYYDQTQYAADGTTGTYDNSQYAADPNQQYGYGGASATAASAATSYDYGKYAGSNTYAQQGAHTAAPQEPPASNGPPSHINIFTPGAPSSTPAAATAPPAKAEAPPPSQPPAAAPPKDAVTASHFTPAGGRDLTSGYGDAPMYQHQPSFYQPPTAKPPPPATTAPVSTAPPAAATAPPQSAQPAREPPKPAPQPVKKKSAPGDVSKVAEDMRPVVNTLQRLMKRCFDVAKKPVEQRKLQEVNKKVTVFFQHLNDHEVDVNSCHYMKQLSLALDHSDFAGAQRMQTEMIAANYQDWMTGIKFLIQIASRLPPQ